MKKFKKIYIEITNICNLSCSFCSKSTRQSESMSINKFEEVIEKIKNYTDTIYLHVKGEPLLHPKLKEIFNICDANNIRVNLTTNGILLKNKVDELTANNCLKTINISLHCENNKENYFEDIFYTVDNNLKNKIIVYRLWTLKDGKLDKKSTYIVDKIISNYNLSTEVVDKIKTEKNIKIANNIYIDKDNKFEWPTINSRNKSLGFCMALKTQIGILVDGTVIPCCLDSNGEIKLGNIFRNSMEDILNSDRYINLQKSFQDRKPCELLCQKCTFKNKFK